MTSSRGWMLSLLVLGSGAIALVPAAQQSNQESLRSALDAVTRKQRSLDPVDYNDLHSFKYHGGNAGDRKFNRDFDEEDEEIEFLPGDDGQLETVDEGFQAMNNKLLERALLDYLAITVPEQEEPIPSIFRERERSSSRKRGSAGDRANIDNKDLTKLLMEELQDGFPYDQLAETEDDDDYLNALQTLYDRYRAGRGNKVYETAGPMSWGELFGKDSLPRGHAGREGSEFVDRDQDQSILYLTPTQRRNVNGRYPIGRDFGGYRRLSKRYPVAKRSPRPTQTKLKTDPKVAQDLGALFGTQSTDAHSNRTAYAPDHDHDHAHDHDHNHEHNHDHDHDHDHGHEHEHIEHENSSATPTKVTSIPKNQKENITKAAESKFVQVRKKSVDWSQYFGIDRRKKKATFVAGQGTQNQDDEWMLQRYYENMAENLKPKDDEVERQDKFERIDPKLKYIKDLIEDTLKYANLEDEADRQKVNDILMARMAAAYTLQKMRKALNDLRNSVAAQKEAQRVHNLTSNGNSNGNGGSRTENEKRSNINDGELEEVDNCPELRAIESQCRIMDDVAGDMTRVLYGPCVKMMICNACARENEAMSRCLDNFAMEADLLCPPREQSYGKRDMCRAAARMLPHVKPPSVTAAECRVDSCLQRYRYRYEEQRNSYPRPPLLLQQIASNR